MTSERARIASESSEQNNETKKSSVPLLSKPRLRLAYLPNQRRNRRTINRKTHIIARTALHPQKPAHNALQLFMYRQSACFHGRTGDTDPEFLERREDGGCAGAGGLGETEVVVRGEVEAFGNVAGEPEGASRGAIARQRASQGCDKKPSDSSQSLVSLRSTYLKCLLCRSIGTLSNNCTVRPGTPVIGLLNTSRIREYIRRV